MASAILRVVVLVPFPARAHVLLPHAFGVPPRRFVTARVIYLACCGSCATLVALGRGGKFPHTCGCGTSVEFVASPLNRLRFASAFGVAPRIGLVFLSLAQHASLS